MGLDIYLRWNGQTEEEKSKQYTGYSTVHGHVGYLREAYHGGPYATLVLCGCKETEEDGKRIRASKLRKNLPRALAAAKERAKKVYSEELTDDSPVLKSFVDFVELAERLEADGKNPRVEISG